MANSPACGVRSAFRTLGSPSGRTAQAITVTRGPYIAVNIQLNIRGYIRKDALACPHRAGC